MTVGIVRRRSSDLEKRGLGDHKPGRQEKRFLSCVVVGTYEESACYVSGVGVNTILRCDTLGFPLLYYVSHDIVLWAQMMHKGT